MFKGLHKNEILAAAAGVGIFSAAFAAYLFFSMSPGKGLKIHHPDFTTIANHSSTKSFARSFEQISSSSFMAAFGLNIAPKVAMATVTAVLDKPAQSSIASTTATASAPVIIKPSTVDLEKVGYRLRGIVFENGHSTAFVFVPAQKKTMVIREKASGTVILIEAGMRNVKLQTPEGTGILTLESAKGSPAGSSSTSSPGGATGGAISQNPNDSTQSILPHNSLMQGQNPDQANNISGASSIANLINQGQLKVTQQRGKYAVEVRQIPEALKGYNLKQGDRIMGTDNNDFSRSQDIALNLGDTKNRLPSLKIQRNGQTMMLQPPAPPPESKKPADQNQTSQENSQKNTTSGQNF